MKRIYDRECDTFNGGRTATGRHEEGLRGLHLNDTGQYALGCDDVGTQNGKFTLRLGDPAGSPDSAPYAAIDLHQIGTGYKGHVWYTYLYPVSRNGRSSVPGRRNSIWHRAPGPASTWSRTFPATAPTPKRPST